MIAALMILALAAPEVAAPVQAAPPAAAPAKPAEDRLVCRSETPIGSKLPTKTCIRKSERDRQERESKEALQLIQRRSLGPVRRDDR